MLKNMINFELCHLHTCTYPVIKPLEYLTTRESIFYIIIEIKQLIIKIQYKYYTGMCVCVSVAMRVRACICVCLDMRVHVCACNQRVNDLLWI